jgi:hypothetical protein
MEIPRVRYEVQTRRIRVGNSPPIADAGPDLSGVAAGTVTLDGSNSYDPDGDAITYQWIQDAGQTVGISNPTSARASFNAVLGQNYVFRLIVKDSYGAQATARVRIGTKSADRATVLSFSATPATIQAGQASTLSWNVQNADTVVITGLGTVPSTGTASVSPTTTTTYVLTARNAVNESTASTTIVVNGSSFQYCYASPSNITQGQTADLTWATIGASSVSISNSVGTVGANGTFSVAPLTSTSYVLTATGPGGTTATCSIAVNVTPVGLPSVIRFSASPTTINSGDTSTLLWNVQGATKVSISTLGDVPVAGTQSVSPAATTVYVLTATNLAGSVTSQATVNVNVINLPVITSFTATPTTSPAPLSPVVLTCSTTDATKVDINGFTFSGPVATMTVNPDRNFTYVCTAYNARNQSVSKSVNVTVTPAPATTSTPPTIVIAGGNQKTIPYEVAVHIDASASTSNTGGPLTFVWQVADGVGVIQGQNTSAVDVQFTVDRPSQTVIVTATDSKGNSASQSIQVTILPHENN